MSDTKKSKQPRLDEQRLIWNPRSQEYVGTPDDRKLECYELCVRYKGIGMSREFHPLDFDEIGTLEKNLLHWVAAAKKGGIEVQVYRISSRRTRTDLAL